MIYPTRKTTPSPGRKILAFQLIFFVLLSLFVTTGCQEKEPPPIQLVDLDSGELLYVTRMVILERAKAVALIDRPAGNAILDSLATAWGDSARQETVLGLPTDPVRAGQVGDLLRRMLEAETDSLILAARPERLKAPLPDPLPVDPEEAKAKAEALAEEAG